MNSSATSHSIANPWLRWLLYLVLIGCGLGIFVACGILGGLAGLDWFA